MNLREITKKYPKIRFIEDCSQSHGGYVKNKAIGTFGDISCFSTMYRKNLVSNGTGGIIFTKKKYYDLIRSLADRGKQFQTKNFNPKNYNFYKGLSLNFNSDEISCFIGNENLKKIKSINLERRKRIKFLENNLDKKSIFIICKPKNMKQYSPFFLTLKIKEKYKKKIKLLSKKLLNLI